MKKDYTLENLELANKTLRRYIHELEEKILRYEHILQGCPKFRMEKSPSAKSANRFESPYEEAEDPEDDWFDEEDDWEDDDFDEEDFEEDFDV